jgi:hypothetical protein
MLHLLSPHSPSSFLLLLLRLILPTLLSTSSSVPPPQVLESVVDLGFQYNLPLFSMVSGHCLPVFTLSPH